MFEIQSPENMTKFEKTGFSNRTYHASPKWDSIKCRRLRTLSECHTRCKCTMEKIDIRLTVINCIKNTNCINHVIVIQNDNSHSMET